MLAKSTISQALCFTCARKLTSRCRNMMVRSTPTPFVPFKELEWAIVLAKVECLSHEDPVWWRAGSVPISSSRQRVRGLVNCTFNLVERPASERNLAKTAAKLSFRLQRVLVGQAVVADARGALCRLNLQGVIGPPTWSHSIDAVNARNDHGRNPAGSHS